MLPHRLSVLPIMLLLIACSPSAAPTQPRSQGETTMPARSGLTTLRSIVKVEPASLAMKPLEPTSISVARATSLFNATLDHLDGGEVPHPYLAEGLPQLNTDTWRVRPDGRMETTWRLRDNLTWHDGTTLTTDDFVFAWRVYNTPELGTASAGPNVFMEEAIAPDPRTLVVRWSRLYLDADSMEGNFQALPRHILESAYAQGDHDAFRNRPYWSSHYVGAGPYRLERWEPGVAIEGAAFEGFTRGRPKIDRVVVRFMPDETTALTALLAGEADLATDRSIRFAQAQVLKREWGPANGGTVVLTASQPRLLYFQVRPELSRPGLLTDVRGPPGNSLRD